MEKKYHSFLNIILFLRKFHYGSEDAKMMEEDMANNNINETMVLINPKELQDL
jgi:hypothetical protein